MNEAKIITWHYVMDIHDSGGLWYSLDRVRMGLQ